MEEEEEREKEIHQSDKKSQTQLSEKENFEPYIVTQQEATEQNKSNSSAMVVDSCTSDL